MSTCSHLGEKRPPNQLSPGSLKSHQLGGQQEPRAGCPAPPPGTGHAPRASCLPVLDPPAPRAASLPHCGLRVGQAAHPWLLFLSGGHSIGGRQCGLQHGGTGLWARISPAGRRQAASRGAGTLVWETEPSCFSPLEDPFPGDTPPLEVESPLATCLSATVDPTRPLCVQAATSHSLVVLGPRSLHGHRVSGMVTDSSGRQDIGSPCDPRSALDP